MLKKCFIFMFCLLCSLPAMAEVSFEAEVEVETEAENSAQAKDAALLKAQREAFLQVAGRLTNEKNLEQLNQLTDSQLMHFIREISVLSETSSPTSYRAKFKMMINGVLLKQYLAENEWLQAPQEPADVLLITLYSPAAYGEKRLFEDDNIWRKAWIEKGDVHVDNFAFKVIRPTADNLHILQNIDDLRLTNEVYQALAEKNQIADIYFIHAVQAGKQTMAVMVKKLPDGQEQRQVIFDEEDALMDKAISETLTVLTTDLAQQASRQEVTGQKILAVYQYHRLKDWLKTEQLLRQVPQIQNIETGASTNGKVQINIEYVGSYHNLVAALQKIGLSLSSDNGVYTLQ